jgi:hypothetical protein
LEVCCDVKNAIFVVPFDWEVSKGRDHERVMSDGHSSFKRI